MLSESAYAARIIDLRDRLPHSARMPKRRLLSGIERYWIHHTATPIKTTATVIANYHVKVLGWPTIGYHWVIYPNGTIAQCLDLPVVGYNVSGRQVIAGISAYNWHGIGIALIGSFTSESRPYPAQLSSLAWLLEHLDTTLKAAIPSLPYPTVYAHAESDVPTECPGQDWQFWLNPIRQARIERLN